MSIDCPILRCNDNDTRCVSVRFCGQRGAFGAITASANYAFAFVDSSAGGDGNAQAVLADVTSVVQQYGVAGTKYAATLAGMREGRSRFPLQPLDTQAKQSVAEAYETMLGYIVS